MCRYAPQMRPHHTKNKGDLGILHAQLDLAKKGYGVLTPLTEHETFDLVAYKNDRFLRVQVKYRAAVRGVIVAPFSTCWADRHGVHTTPVDKSAVAPPRNAQQQRLRWATEYLEIPASVQGVQAGVPDRA